MQSSDFRINGVTYTVEAWDSEGHGFYPMIHTQDGQPVNVGADAIGDDVYCATPEQAIEDGHQALLAVLSTPGYSSGHGIYEDTDA